MSKSLIKEILNNTFDADASVNLSKRYYEFRDSVLNHEAEIKSKLENQPDLLKLCQRLAEGYEGINFESVNEYFIAGAKFGFNICRELLV